MDALNSVIDSLQLGVTEIYGLQLAAPWGMALSADGRTAFHFVEAGGCWLRVGDAACMRAEPGDLLVVTHQPQYALLDALSTAAVPLPTLLTHRDPDGIVRWDAPASAGASTRLLCSSFEPRYRALSPLFSLLPPLIHVRGENGRAQDWLSVSIRFILEERQQQKPGHTTVISRLLDLIFIMVLRYWIEHQPIEDGGWLAALYHPQIGAALRCIHQEPARAWTVELLAGAAGMSRSRLAARFTEMVGEAPMQYLARWRMQVAMRLLVEQPDTTLEAVAREVGYASAFAFSKAFKRVVGVAPDPFRRSRAG